MYNYGVGYVCNWVENWLWTVWILLTFVLILGRIEGCVKWECKLFEG